MLLLAQAALLAACNGKSTEEQELAKMRDGLIYSQYHGLSEKGLPVALVAWQKGSQLSGRKDLPALTDDHVCLARVMLAETDILSNGKCPLFPKAAAGSLRAVLFQRAEWPGLAAAENQRAKQMLPPGLKGDEAQEQIITNQLVRVEAMFGRWLLAIAGLKCTGAKHHSSMQHKRFVAAIVQAHVQIRF
jgi:hypothetical protein